MFSSVSGVAAGFLSLCRIFIRFIRSTARSCYFHHCHHAIQCGISYVGPFGFMVYAVWFDFFPLTARVNSVVLSSSPCVNRIAKIFSHFHVFFSSLTTESFRILVFLRFIWIVKIVVIRWTWWDDQMEHYQSVYYVMDCVFSAISSTMDQLQFKYSITLNRFG